jgi:cysteinyl-tRNA synthetase
LFDLSKEVNKLRDKEPTQAIQLGNQLRRLGGIIGLLQIEPEVFLRGQPEILSAEEIERLITERQAARSRRDWAMADQIRDQLQARGIILEDTAQGTSWRAM